ncbi:MULTISPECIES: hypothetical protein [Nocardia]|uniref:Centromere-binding protein ParB C-terminal domain-containing protein n=2 Tax=Nocardia TaxID=1817 RepID=A0A7G1KW20_9NOCA|nr:hypothetical protein [Nocardia wallacei]BCK59465.1 hypothetical protein NWFMUON74_72370 [Nocardia wallacei]
MSAQQKPGLGNVGPTRVLTREERRAEAARVQREQEAAESPAATESPEKAADTAASASGGASASRGSGKAAGKGKKSGEGSERSKRLAGSSDVLLSLPSDLKDRMESVIAYTYPHTGINQQQAFIRWSITKLCAELEARYNDGAQWPEIPKRKAV